MADDDELARVRAEFPHLAGDDPGDFACMLAGARRRMTDEEYSQLEARFRDAEARIARAQSYLDEPSWQQVWETACSLPFEQRTYDDPLQLYGLSRWLPTVDELTEEDSDPTDWPPITEVHLEVGLHAIAELAGFFARPIVTLDPSGPERPRIGRTLRDIADLAQSLLLWFEAGDEDPGA